MTNRISPRDWEALSAYLDNQLGKQEYQQLETRLSAEGDLQKALDELRKTRQLLRSIPKYRAPRSFALTPAMVGIKNRGSSQQGAFTMLRLASFLATFFFLFITVGSLIVETNQPVQTVMMSSEIENAREGPPFGMGGGGGGEPVEQPAPAPLPTQEAQVSSLDQESEIVEGGVLEATTSVEGSVVESPEAFQAFTAPMEPQTVDQPVAGEEPVQKANSLQPGAETEPETETKEPSPILLILRVVQVTLAILALITGVGAFLLRRKFL